MSESEREHDGHTVSIPAWPALIVRLAKENDLSCRCGPEYTERRLQAPDCQYHDFYGFVSDLLASPVEDRMEAMGMELVRVDVAGFSGTARIEAWVPASSPSDLSEEEKADG